MNYLKITKYVYLVIGIILLIDAGINWNSNPNAKPWLNVFLAALAIFMFFFRNKFGKKFEKYDSDNSTKK
ncbi:MAG: hypothetical protein ACI9XR_001970 [Flavobacterium sp.]|jgi:hypothetical protein